MGRQLSVLQRRLAALLLAVGCSIQGGHEGVGGDDDDGDCRYEPTQPQELSVTPPGLLVSPQQLIEDAASSFEGTVADAQISLSFGIIPTSVWLSLDNRPDGCVSMLTAVGVATLTVQGNGEQFEIQSSSAELSVRGAEPQRLTAEFIATDDSPLSSLVPEFSRPPRTDPRLRVELAGFNEEVVPSLWTWSTDVSCNSDCTGSGFTIPESLSWAEPELRRED